MVKPAERIEKIFTLLSKKPQVLTNLAKLAGMHYWTTHEYIDLIIDIQNRPQVEKITAGKTVIVRLRED